MPDINPPGSQEWNDCIREAEPIGCEDGAEKIARIEEALAEANGRDSRVLRAELLRLKATLGLLPIRLAAE